METKFSVGTRVIVNSRVGQGSRCWGGGGGGEGVGWQEGGKPKKGCRNVHIAIRYLLLSISTLHLGQLQQRRKCQAPTNLQHNIIYTGTYKVERKSVAFIVTCRLSSVKCASAVKPSKPASMPGTQRHPFKFKDLHLKSKRLRVYVWFSCLTPTPSSHASHIYCQQADQDTALLQAQHVLLRGTLS